MIQFVVRLADARTYRSTSEPSPIAAASRHPAAAVTALAMIVRKGVPEAGRVRRHFAEG